MRQIWFSLAAMGWLLAGPVGAPSAVAATPVAPSGWSAALGQGGPPVLAQGLSLADFQAPPNQLPDPPLLERLLFESPWLSIVGLGLAGAMGFVVLNRAGKTKPALAALGAGLALAAGNFVLAGAVTTDRERLLDATRELIDAIAAYDGDRLEPLLDERLEVLAIQAPRSKQAVVGFVENNLQRYGSILAAVPLPGMRAHLSGERVGETEFGVRVQTSNGGLSSWWLIRWVKVDGSEADGSGGGEAGASPAVGGWRARSIEAIKIPGFRSPQG